MRRKARKNQRPSNRERKKNWMSGNERRCQARHCGKKARLNHGAKHIKNPRREIKMRKALSIMSNRHGLNKCSTDYCAEDKIGAYLPEQKQIRHWSNKLQNRKRPLQSWNKQRQENDAKRAWLTCSRKKSKAGTEEANCKIKKEPSKAETSSGKEK